MVHGAPGLLRLGGRSRRWSPEQLGIGLRRPCVDPRPGRGRWYLHSFYPQQADLDWRNPAVVAAMQDVIRFWADRGIDGFRVDAIDRLLKDPELRDDPPAAAPFGLPIEGGGTLALTNSRNGPGIGDALGAIRSAAGDLLARRGGVPARRPARALPRAPRRGVRVRALPRALGRGRAAHGDRARTGAGDPGRARVGVGGVEPRLPARGDPVGAGGRARRHGAAADASGPVFLYQGEEIGQRDGPGADPPIDRAGRDAHRHPVQWEPEPLAGASRRAGRG